MRLAHLVILAASCAGAARAEEAPAAAVGPGDGRITYMGRIEMSERGARMGYPGVTVRFAYRGPAPELRLTGDTPDCYFNLACNGWDPVVLHLRKGENVIALPTGVAPR